MNTHLHKTNGPRHARWLACLFTLMLFGGIVSRAQTINTYAGTGNGGNTGNGGPATAADITCGYGICEDPSGNVFFTTGSGLRKIDPSGIITNFVPSGFAYSLGVVSDNSGNLYVADYSGNRVYKVTSLGVVSVFAGTGSGGYNGDNILATSAQLSSPTGIAIDNAGNIYISDGGNNRIRKIDLAGIITTVGGTGTSGYSGNGGPATSADMAYPFGLDVDAAGNIYISELGNSVIRKISSTGTITLVGGTGSGGYSGDGGPATSAQFIPVGLALDNSGNIYIGDESNFRVRKIDLSGIVTTVAGNGTNGFSGDGGPATSAELYYPNGLTITSSGTMIIVDAANNRLRSVGGFSSTPLSAASGGQTNVLCNGASTGSATVTASGGVTPYTYSWSPSGGTAATATGLAAGNYTVTVTDAASSTTTQTFVITQATAITLTPSQTNETPCNTSNNGTASVSASGGTPGYTYLWSTGGTSSSVSSLTAGGYTVTVTDAALCTATQTYTITQPTPIVGTPSQTNVSCNGGTNGTATVVASGGGSPFYSYSWAPSGGTGTTATGLSAGNYTVTITNPSLCTGTQTYTITQPAVLAITPSQTNVSCNGGTNGTATATVTGGTSPYTYSWSNSATTSSITGLSAGNYTVTVTDNKGCTATQTYTITAPAALSTTGSQFNVACFGNSTGSATVSVSGGTSPYSYSWAPSGGTAATASGLAAGNYTVTVTDFNSCSATRTFTITQPSAALSTTGSSTNVSCFGGSNGTATVSASGGTSPYTYSWAPSGGTGATASGLAANVYTVTVTDNNGCTATRTYNVTQPAAALSTTGTQTNVACNGGNTGSATVVASGGTTPYSYSWAPSGGTAATATGLSTGNYTVTVTDFNSCTTTHSFNISQPAAPLSSTGTQTNVTCNGGSDGSASVTVSGGTTPYTYSWAPSGGTSASAINRPAGTYTVTVTDFNGCTHTRTFNITQPTAIVGTPSQTNVSCFGGSNGTATVVASGGSSSFFSYSWAPYGGTGTTASGLVAGTYTVTITNALLCTGTATYTITQPTALATTGSSTNTSCNGGSNGTATVVASGGTGAYTYSWAPTGGTNATATGLAAGNYTVTVTDANFCTTTRTFNIGQPAAISLSGSSTNVLCNGGATGTATVSATGGTGSYTYSWAPSGGTAATATGLSMGVYTVTVTDANSCTATRTYNITQPAALSTSGSQTAVSCNGGSNGTATVIPSGGTSPYTYSWAPSGGTAATATGLSATNYTVTVTDFNGCTTTRTYSITQPTAMTSTGSQTNVSCNGGSNGTATVAVTGGTGAYTYSWAPSGGTAATTTGRPAGVYTVTVTDANSCTHTRTFNITQPALLTTSGSQTNVTCFGLNNGTATVVPSGGTSPYFYSWAPTGGSTATATGLAPNTYTVTVTDVNLCTATRTYTITQPAALAVTGTNTNVLCNGASTATATVTPTGGTTPYTYSWAPSGGTAATANNLAAGTYTATVTDFNGCTITRTYNITQPTAIAANPSQVNVSCNGGTNGSAAVAPTGGVGPYTYSWAPVSGTGTSITNLPSATYTVTITDANSCVRVQTFNITQPNYLSTTGSQTNVLCNGGSTGTATVLPSGGTTPYTYSWAPTGGTAATATGLAMGVYTVTVTDGNLCTATRTYNITQPTTLTATGTQTAVSCYGGSNASATVIPAGGTAPYTYSWAPYGGNAASASALAAGNYTATVTDANGCTVNQTYTIVQPNLLAYTSTQSNITCYGANNGAASINVTGGTAPYTYNWNPGGYTTSAVAGLSAGGYTVTATDANGCTVVNSYNITEPTVLVALAAATTPVCSSDSLSLIGSAYGGVTPYYYSWTGPVSGGVPVMIIPSSTAAMSGNYTLTVTDGNGCTATSNTSAVVYQTPTVTTQPQAVTACVGSSVIFNITAIGTGIGYQWRANGVNISNTGVYAGANSPTLSISDVTGLNGTMYDVIVTGICTPDTSISVMLTAPTYNTWTGTVDTAWSHVGNWQCGVVPNIASDVIIPGSAPRMPLVDIPGAKCNSLTINANASVGFVGTGSQLEVNADITNLGNFNAGNGAVLLSGSAPQSIPGITYGELEIEGGSVKTTQGNLTVTGNLILSDGYLQLGSSNLTLSQAVIITGGDANSFIITNGTGKVIAQNLGTGGVLATVTFPVGTTPGVYTPASLFNSGTADNFSVRVIDGIYSHYNNEVPVGFPLSDNSVDKTWFINEAVDGGSNAVVTLSWPLGAELPGFNNSLCDVSHYIEDSSAWESGPVGPVTGTVTLFSRSRSNIMSFSPFGLGTASAPLGSDAVTLTGIYNLSDKSVDLSWHSSNDPDVVSYTVERSTDAVTFTTIGSKDAGVPAYELTDREAGKLNAKQVYYRVQVATNDGSYAYTNTVKVDIASSVVTYGMTLYPNPATGSEVYVSLSDNALATDMDVVISNVLGQEVSRQHYDAGTYNANAITVKVGDLAQGMYTLRVKQAGSMVQTIKFTKK